MNDRYLLISSRDPTEPGEGGSLVEIALGLAEARQRVALFLVQAGVLAVLTRLRTAGVRILAEQSALEERAVHKLSQGVEPASLAVVIDQLAEEARTLWH